MQAADLTADRLFIVPGNYDLCRETICEILPPELQQPLASDTAVQKWLTDSRKKSRALEPFETYRDFIINYNNQETPDYATIRQFTAGGKQVALLGINSAWMMRKQKCVVQH